MNAHFTFWFVLRVVLLVIAVLEGITNTDPGITWHEALLFPAGFAIGLFVWLSGWAFRPDVEWSDPYSLTKPFFQ
jgi:hypothetical protein